MTHGRGTESNPTPFELQQAAIARMVRGIAAALGGPWDHFEFRFAQAGLDSISQVSAERDGEPIRLKVPKSVTDEAQSLRGAMHEPGKGTWFGMTLRASSDGRAQTDFDDDSPAAIWTAGGGVADIAYYDDQQRYPRDEAHISDWLRPRLQLGRIARQKFDAMAERKRCDKAD